MVNSVTGSLAGEALAGTGQQGAKALGKEDFLKLLVAQLQHQDPLNPSDPTEFTAQLSQFSSLEQLFEVNKNLDGLTGMSTGMEQLSALNLIGRQIVAKSGSFELSPDGVDLGYHLDSSAASVRVKVLNANNHLVAEISDNPVGPGQHFLRWDGSGLNGQVLTGGEYTFQVEAQGNAGEPITAEPLVKSRISIVDLSQPNARLLTAHGQFTMPQIAYVED